MRTDWIDDNNVVVTTDKGLFVYNFIGGFDDPKSVLTFRDNFQMSTATFDHRNKTAFILSKEGSIRKWFTMGELHSYSDAIDELPGVEVLDVCFLHELGSLVMRNVQGLWKYIDEQNSWSPLYMVR